jgi:hypothetical protein
MSNERQACQRCGVVHTSKPFNLEDALSVAALALRDEIERDLLRGFLRHKSTPENPYIKLDG